MAAVTGNANGTKAAQNDYSDKQLSTVQQRMQFHGKLHEGSKCDLESPASLVANVNIKQLLTPAAFDSLPTHYQNELIKLLPEADRLGFNDSQEPLAMTVTALSNEFFAKSCVEYRDRLRNGEFVVSGSSKPDVEPVVWECDSTTLGVKLTETGVRKAGEPFVCTPKEQPAPPVKRIKTMKKNVLELKKKTIASTSNPREKAKPPTTARQSLLKHKVPTSKSKALESNKPAASVTLPRTAAATITTRPAASTSTAKHIVVTQHKKEQISPGKSVYNNTSPTVITKLKRVTENTSQGVKVTKVIPIPVVVRNPHGQVVTTLANCNPLLSEMIKNKNTQTQTAVPVKVQKKRSLLPTILKRGNPVIITLKTSKDNPSSTTNGETVNRAVSEVIAKIQSTQTQPINGTSHNKAVIVTCNGSGTNGTTTTTRQILTTKAVNLERSKQICEQTQPTLNLERSYQICKQVLGSTGSSSLVSVVVGPGGKKTTILSKPVRNRLQLQNSSSAASSISHNQLSQLSTDIAIYKNKCRGRPLLTNSGHVFLAMKTDTDGYATKAYKRKASFKIKSKKKLSKLSSVKKSSVTPPHPSSAIITSDQLQSTAIISTPPTITSTTTISSSSIDVTTVTDSVLACQPIASVTSSTSTTTVNSANSEPATQSSTPSNSNTSLLSNCMCNLRPLVVCAKCGAFNHAECMSKDYCLACLVSEN